MAMICIEWWSFEVGAFLTGTAYTILNIILLMNQCMQFITHLIGYTWN